MFTLRFEECLLVRPPLNLNQASATLPSLVVHFGNADDTGTEREQLVHRSTLSPNVSAKLFPWFSANCKKSLTFT